MATSTLFLIAASIILCNAQSQRGGITFLQSSVQLTQRTLPCPGEAVTLTCTSDASGIIWNSEPSLSMSGGRGSIVGFVHDEVSAGSRVSYLRNYTEGTAFFISAVVEDVFNGVCNSSITFVPIPNDDGRYPTDFAPNSVFNITCFTGSTEPLPERTRSWEYRVADVPKPVPTSNAMLTYIANHKVVSVEINNSATVNVERSHYEVSINGSNGMKTTVNVTAQSDQDSHGQFYPVEEMPKMAQIVTVDVCGRKSDPTIIMISRSIGSSSATFGPMLTLAITLMLAK